MSITKFIGVLLGALVLVASPLFASAQTSTTGLLNVYVQVINQTGTSYSPSNFTVTVSGGSPSPSTFPGSQSGTVVSLNPGSFKVTVVGNQYGFSPSYSVGCDNTIAAGQTHTCVVTMSGFNIYPYPQPYPYPYPQQPVPLTCTPSVQTVAAGQQATFSAQGGVGGTYNWFANGRTHANVGPRFTTVIEATGSQLVTVTNGSQTASCSVTVSSFGGYYPNYPTPTPGYPSYTAYPQLPNTGLEPLSATTVALAVVLLLGAAIATVPYARKAFAIAVR